MATFHTNISGEETYGEKTLYYRFRDKLSDDYHIWHNFINHRTGVEFDFIIFHPHDGLFIIEVKDWEIEQIKEIDDRKIKIIKNGNIETHGNPLAQVRKGSFDIRNSLSRNKMLIHPSGPHEGNLFVPVNYGVAFTNIEYKEILDAGFQDFLPQNKILDKNVFTGFGYTDRDYELALEALQDIGFKFTLNTEQWNAIMAFLGTPVVNEPATGELIGVFDQNQENLVSFKLYKQILIEGPAGSGKSMILVKRALHMKEMHPDWSIGVFCFNVVMANYLRLLFAEEKKDHGIIVSHIHGVKSFKIEPGSFDAVLIDEAQDLDKDYLARVVPLLKNPAVPLTLFFDKRQAIYFSEDLPKLLNDVGFSIESQKELVRQQRSVHVLIALAFFNAMYDEQKDLESIKKDTFVLGERIFIGFQNPVSAVASGVSRHFKGSINNGGLDPLREEIGKRIFLYPADNVGEMLESFIKIINQKVEAGEATYKDFLIIYPERYLFWRIPTTIKTRFLRHKIPFRIIDNGKYQNIGLTAGKPKFTLIEEGDNRDSFDFKENKVLATTVFQSKGLDAKHVAVFGFEKVQHGRSNRRTQAFKENKRQTETKIFEENKPAELGYVALTRAKEECHIYYMGENKPVKILQQLLESL